MSRTLTVSDAAYDHLAALARQSGLPSVEEWLEQRQKLDVRAREVAIDRIADLQARLAATYGEMPDSTPLITEDRAR